MMDGSLDTHVPKNVVHLERAISKTMYYPHKILIAQLYFETHNFELEFSLKPIQI